MEEQFDNFCHMLIEDFLMQKGMHSTLTEFRKEWDRPNENLSLLSWYEMSLKLHLPEISSRAKYGTVLENLSWELMSDASMRCRKPPEVIATSMAIVPKVPKLPYIDTLPPPATTTIEKRAERCYSSEYQRYTMASDAALIATAKKKLRDENNDVEITKRYYNGSVPATKRITDGSTKNRSSSSNWIPDDVRYRQLGRDLAVAKENLHDISMRAEETRRENRALRQTDLERAHVMEKLGVKRKVECACCLQMFSYVNLKLKVSHKAIIDLRNIWSNGEGGWWTADDERWGVVPRCYDDVLVCLICSQFFHKQAEYRPSFEQTEYEKRRQAHLETKRREKEYWDPLRMVEKDRELMEQEMARQQELEAIQLQQLEQQKVEQAANKATFQDAIQFAMHQGDTLGSPGNPSGDNVSVVPSVTNDDKHSVGASAGRKNDDETLASMDSEK